MELFAPAVFDTDRLPALEQDAPRKGMGDKPDAPGFPGGTQIGIGGGPAEAVVDGHFHGAEAFLLAAVVIVGDGITCLAAGIDEGLVQRIETGATLDVHGSCGATPAGLSAFFVIAGMGVFHALEIWLDVLEGPALGAHVFPGVEVTRVAADIDHAVDGG